MSRKKVLYVLHNHPPRPGGAEAYALELYEAMRESDEFEPVLVARIGPTGTSIRAAARRARPSAGSSDDPNQYFVYTDAERVRLLPRDLPRQVASTPTYFADFLRSPTGPTSCTSSTRTSSGTTSSRSRAGCCRTSPIVYTLHEYLPICHRDGQMVRTNGEQLCTAASPRRCNECFPDWTPQHFFLRERFIKSHLAHVDMFLAPSRFLLERYVDWGIPRERIRFEDYGRLPADAGSQPPVESRPRNRLGFFGQ